MYKDVGFTCTTPHPFFTLQLYTMQWRVSATITRPARIQLQCTDTLPLIAAPFNSYIVFLTVVESAVTFFAGFHTGFFPGRVSYRIFTCEGVGGNLDRGNSRVCTSAHPLRFRRFQWNSWNKLKAKNTRFSYKATANWTLVSLSAWIVLLYRSHFWTIPLIVQTPLSFREKSLINAFNKILIPEMKLP